MSRHEIEIEGLPEGFEPVKIKVAGDHSLAGLFFCEMRCRPKVRKYDHSKTLDDVLVTSLSPDDVFLLQKKCVASMCRIADVWQPNIHGKCPVDGEACWVRVKRANGRDSEEMLASSICWEFGFGAATIVAYQFIRLVDGVEF